jgi:hypothetical protein
MLYVLVEMANFQSRSTIGEYFVVEYNLEKRRDIAKRVTSIDISVQTIEKEEEKRTCRYNTYNPSAIYPSP